MADAVISFRDVSKSFGERRVLEDVSLDDLEYPTFLRRRMQKT